MIVATAILFASIGAGMERLGIASGIVVVIVITINAVSQSLNNRKPVKS